uniref:Uncharacterized protein n=1 Tax=Anopheles albimanus TaxID=7167 RepID=A0A182FX99_ANOAL
MSGFGVILVFFFGVLSYYLKMKNIEFLVSL